MFKKLKTTFSVPEFIIGNEVVHYGELENSGIWFNELSINTNMFYEVIPERYRNYFIFRLMQIKGAVPPHTDSGVKVTINFYFGGTGGTTVFYKLLSETPGVRQIENQTNGVIFDKKDLKIVSAFCANIGDVYVLDITQPHSVSTLPSDNTLRKAFALQTNRFTFEEVVEMLKETKSI